jgi:glycosyltransferase involved in cell wall biosynthesis
MHIVGKNDSSLKEYFTNEKCKLVIHGSLPYLALQNVYKECDLLLLHTLHDNFPNIILESFVFGPPVFAFNTGGVRDLVCAKTGYLTVYNSVDDIIRGIIYTMDNIEEISNYILNNNHKCSYKEIPNKFEIFFWN